MIRANTCRIPGMVPRASYMLIHLVFLPTQKVMRKLRHRVVKSLAQSCRTRKWLSGEIMPFWSLMRDRTQLNPGFHLENLIPNKFTF